MILTGRKIAVVGLGHDGIALVKALAAEGSIVSAYGSGSDEQEKSIRVDLQSCPCQLIWQEVSQNSLLGYDYIINTPGGGLYRSAVQDAIERGAVVLSDLDLAWNFFDAPVIAVTGTSGKTTTISLLEKILKAQGYRCALYGGDFLRWANAIQDRNHYDYYLLELSSRRLEVSNIHHPWISILLNLYSAHSDRHPGSVMQYYEAKARIFAGQTETDYLIHEGTAMNLLELIRAKNPRPVRIPFVLHGSVSGQGVYRDQKKLIVIEADGTRKYFDSSEMTSLNPALLMDAMAAVAAANLCKVEPERIQVTLKEFVPLPCRMENIRTLNGVTYIDDSTAANWGAAVWALNGIAGPIVWIVSGTPYADRSALTIPSFLIERIKLMILAGSRCHQLLTLFQGIKNIQEAIDLCEAVIIAHENATNGDTVLFSPGFPPDLIMEGASRSRGQIFKEHVNNLPECSAPLY
jgi:UDP-N-acetylmuramoylalanine--D-glutamate ligase